jgi:hypothetical protein
LHGALGGDMGFNPDGQRLRPLMAGRNQAYISPDFTPDGQYIVVSRSNDLWLYHKDGGSGLRLTGQAQPGQQPTRRARRRESTVQLHGRVGRRAAALALAGSVE